MDKADIEKILNIIKIFGKIEYTVEKKVLHTVITDRLLFYNVSFEKNGSKFKIVFRDYHPVNKHFEIELFEIYNKLDSAITKSLYGYPKKYNSIWGVIKDWWLDKY